MTRFRTLLYATAVPIFSTSLALLGQVRSENLSKSTNAIPTLAGTPSQTNTQQRGSELARQYCSACHLFPEPHLLVKREWAHHILPQMARWLGVEPMNYESQQDGKILEQAGIFPSGPIISEEDWFAIWNYYVSTAPSQAVPPPPKPKATSELKNFRVRKLNFTQGAPMISLVKINPTQKRLFVGDQFAGILATIDPLGKILGTARVASTPVSLTEERTGYFVTLIGNMFPSEALQGSVMFVPKGAGDVVTLLDKLRRPTHTAIGDLNQDGRPDLVVCQYGNRLGRVSWFESKANGSFEEHVLLDQPGAIRAELLDLNRDGRLDIVVLMAQAREGVYIFYNQGQGQFRLDVPIEQPPTFGYAGFELLDFNHDGFPDILTVNGDNGDNPTPHKAYHGVRLYLNDGTNHFKETWFYPMEGAYGVRAADFDGDGDLDIAAIAYFPDFSRQPIEAFVYLENRGDLRFEAHTLREADAGRWMMMDVGDLDGDGDLDIALGSFTGGPTTIPIPASVRENWKTNGAAVLVLENLRR